MKITAKHDGYSFSVSEKMLVVEFPDGRKNHLPVRALERGIYWAERIAGKKLDWYQVETICSKANPVDFQQ